LEHEISCAQISHVYSCHDLDPQAVQKAVTKNPHQYLVLHIRWLFDSISRGSPETNFSQYVPPASKAKALWQLCCANSGMIEASESTL